MKSYSNISEILAFLSQLQANNNRPWFMQHKAQYDALRQAWEHDMERLIELMAQVDDQVCGLNVKNCVYRIYRDVRFSNDKSPYKNYFSGVLGKGGRHTKLSCYYVHFQPDNIILGGGIWCPDRPVLDKLRSLIDAEPDEFLKAVQPALDAGYQWDSDSLKRVPKGFDAAHPMARFLKMKEYLLLKRCPASYLDVDDWVARVAASLPVLKPMHDFLNYVFDDD